MSKHTDRTGPLSRPLSVALSLLVTAAAVGCGDSLSPEEISGNYSLDRVAGDTLPTVIGQTTISGGSEADTTVTLEIVNGQFTLSSDQSYSLSLSAQETKTADGSGSSNSDGETQNGDYTVDGGNLILTPTQSDTINLMDYPFQVRTTATAPVHRRRLRIGIFRDVSPFSDTLALRFVK